MIGLKMKKPIGTCLVLDATAGDSVTHEELHPATTKSPPPEQQPQQPYPDDQHVDEHQQPASVAQSFAAYLNRFKAAKNDTGGDDEQRPQEACCAIRIMNLYSPSNSSGGDGGPGGRQGGQDEGGNADELCCHDRILDLMKPKIDANVNNAKVRSKFGPTSLYLFF